MEKHDASSATPQEVDPDAPKAEPVAEGGAVDEQDTDSAKSSHVILDQSLLDQLETNASVCAENVSHLLGSLRSALHAVRAVQCPR